MLLLIFIALFFSIVVLFVYFQLTLQYLLFHQSDLQYRRLDLDP